MVDEVQVGLSAWVTRGDRRLGREVVDTLTKECRARVRQLLECPAPDEVEELVQDAMVALCTFGPGQRPRVLAPEGTENPAAWRRQVFKNFIVDRMRRRGRRRHAEYGEASGLAPAVEAELWREARLQKGANRAGNSGPLSDRTGSPTPAPEPSTSGSEDLGLMRRDVVRLAPGITIRRRVLLLLAIGCDPSPFAGELASELREDVCEVLTRIREALRAPHDGVQEHLSLTTIRVIWPFEPERKARETARKSLERAIADIQELLEGSP